MGIQALSSAANTALSGLDSVASRVEQVANDVAGGIQDAPGESATQSLAAITQLPKLRLEAFGNAQVLRESQELLDEFPSLPRR